MINDLIQVSNVVIFDHFWEITDHISPHLCNILQPNELMWQNPILFALNMINKTIRASNMFILVDSWERTNQIQPHLRDISAERYFSFLNTHRRSTCTLRLRDSQLITVWLLTVSTPYKYLISHSLTHPLIAICFKTNEFPLPLLLFSSHYHHKA